MYKFSIVIPTRNRSHLLSRLLESIAMLNFQKKNIEVIVVNNNSVDDTDYVIKRFIKMCPEILCKSLYEKRLGPTFARNKGIDAAKYQFIVCLDDDVEIKENMLNLYKNILMKHSDIALIGGKVIAVSNKQKKLNKFIKILDEDSWVFSETRRQERKLSFLKYPDDLISANLLINRNVLSHRKLFNEKFGRKYGNNLIFSEDLELTVKALKDGKKVVYDPRIITKHFIGLDKLNYSYIFSRFYRAGIEHRLIDDQLKIKFYRFNIKEFFKLISKLFSDHKLSDLLKIIREILFFAGYNLSWMTRE